MNAFGIVVFWCVAQVTLLTVVAGVLYRVGRRLGPATGAFVSLVALLLITVITAVSFSPWPNWLPTIESRLPGPVSMHASVGELSERAARQADASEPPSRQQARVASESPLFSALQGFWQEIRNPRSVQHSSNNLNWTGLVAFVVLGGVLIGSIRLGVGFTAVQRYRRESQPVRESLVLELLDVLAAQLQCTRPIEVRESHRVVGAATEKILRLLITKSDGHPIPGF